MLETGERDVNDSKILPLILALSAGLILGMTVGYLAKTAPEPKVEVKALLTPPFVQVTVNGKVVDLGKIRLVPEQPEKQKKSGDVGDVLQPAAWNPSFQPIAFQSEQRGGKSAEAFGIETLAIVLKEFKDALFGDKSKGTPGLRDDIAKGLGDFYGTLRTGVIVAGGTLICFMGWIGINVQRMADNSNPKILTTRV